MTYFLTLFTLGHLLAGAIAAYLYSYRQYYSINLLEFIIITLVGYIALISVLLMWAEDSKVLSKTVFKGKLK